MREFSSIEIDSVDELLSESTSGYWYRRLRVGVSPSGSVITVPVHLVRGSGVGRPRLALLSGVHGDEGLGPLALGRFLANVRVEDVTGIILAVPICNPPAFEQRTRVNAWDGGDMIRLWPGKEDGSLTERMAATVFRSVAIGADALIDLHSGTSVLHEHWAIYANRWGPRSEVPESVEKRSLELARAFGIDQIIRAHPWFGTHMAGGAAGIPSFITEIGGGADYLRNGERYLGEIVDGIANVARAIGVLPGPTPDAGAARVFDIAEEFIAATPDRGYWVPAVRPGETVAPGTAVGRFFDPSTGRERSVLQASVDGVVLNPIAAWPHVGHGQWLLAIGSPVDDPAQGPTLGQGGD